MTYNNERLERIEATLEAISYRIDSNAKAIEANSAAIAANREAIAEVDRTLSEAIGRTLRVVETLAQTVADNREEYKRRNDVIKASINASLERQDWILDYLMHRDGNNQQ